MSDAQLANPIWYSLRNHHRHLMVDGGRAVRYHPDVSVWGALESAEGAEAEAWADLAGLLDGGADVALFRPAIGPVPEAFEVVGRDVGAQMVLRVDRVGSLIEPVDLDADGCPIRVLGEGDLDAIFALHAVAKPGPFRRRTIEMGRYLGYFDDGRLVAMAGERMVLDGFTEISAVSTHPDVAGRGLGALMSSAVAHGILAAGRLPMLHCAVGNERALRLYERLGFETVSHVEYAKLTLS